MSGHLTELDQLESLISKYPFTQLRTETLAKVDSGTKEFPIIGLTLGKDDPTLPTLFLVGGVHGLEKIGSQVLLAYFAVLFQQLVWDEHLQDLFEKVRICSIPILNPAGMANRTRSNPNGVDLMRNSPVESTAPNRPRLVGGHRISPKLPWYRGEEGKGMEIESKTLIDFARKSIFSSKTSLAIDFHSGFGLKDRLWYPYAKTQEPFPKLKEALALNELFSMTYAHHIYKVEPQSLTYTTHGDLWDYLFDLHLEERPENLFLPWTLEMGSWTWLKKNPFQILNPLGLFHPIKMHRYQRVLRRHILMIDFFLRATANSNAWRDR